MTKRYFGTDGIRGTANQAPMTALHAQRIAMAASVALIPDQRSHNHPRRAVIGKDTRLSGYMLEQALTAGFLSMGVDVLLLGPMPTPGVAMMTRSLRADIGVMISASHNPYQDNGIKLFGADGYKLSDESEHQIEDLIDADLSDKLAEPDRLGKAARIDDAPGRYIENVKNTFPKGLTLRGLKIVLDCAHGAAYKVAPSILWELEADTIIIGDQPNGININDQVGATHTQALQDAVIAHQADLGLALDGDADRLIMVDEKGRRIDGDKLMGLIATSWKQRGLLSQNAIVATVMSNLGLERYLKQHGIDLVRTAVGDRHVSEAMREQAINLGGEQSGHMILSDYASTGDGLLAALQILAVLKESGQTMSELSDIFTPVPQLLKNVKISGNAADLLNSAAVQEALDKAKGSLQDTGRLVVRPSGTEPLIRVMAEGDNAELVENTVHSLCSFIESQA